MVREKERGTSFFFLARGEAKVTRGGRLLNMIGAGEFFGEMALLSDQPRNATVTTTSDVVALVVTARSFRDLVEDNPLIALKVMRTVAERIPSSDL